jgi:hypothetical protein
MTELENALLAQALTNADGSVSAPSCCGVPMADDGGCALGCCDDYVCRICGRTLRIEWPD